MIYFKSISAPKLTTTECLNFIAKCQNELKSLAIKYNVAEIVNANDMSDNLVPHSWIYFDEDKIRLIVIKGSDFFNGQEFMQCRHYARWLDKDGNIVQPEENPELLNAAK